MCPAAMNYEFLENMTQSHSMRRAKIPANLVNSKGFRSETNKLTFIYTKTTKMIQIQGGATMLDKAHDTLAEVLSCYGKLVQDGEIAPMPDGTQAWGKAIKESYETGSVSKFLEESEKKTSGEVTDVKKQVMVPNDPEFEAAVAELSVKVQGSSTTFQVGATSSCSSCCRNSLLLRTKCWNCLV